MTTKFENLEEFAQWLNDNSENIADGIIRWNEIQAAVEASGWEFNAADIFIAYDNVAKQGVRYLLQRNGKEIAVVE